MTLTCISPFGRFLPGDEIQVPDDAAFDRAFFAATSDSAAEGANANGEDSHKENQE